MRNTDIAQDFFVAGEITHINERLVIAPCSGRFLPLPPETFTTEGEWVDEGQTIAHIKTGQEAVPVVSIFSGWVMGMLALPGQPVQARTALFRIRP